MMPVGNVRKNQTRLSGFAYPGDEKPPQPVIPAKAGIHLLLKRVWTPALRQAQGRLCAGVTMMIFISTGGPQAHDRVRPAWVATEDPAKPAVAKSGPQSGKRILF
jgi:hypothetical protein